MSETEEKTGGAGQRPPALRRDAAGRVEPASLAALLQWFLSYDPRVAVVNFPAVESLFQWKQQETLREDPEAFTFARAEDRLAVGIMQAVAEHDTERELHGWITELVTALGEVTKTTENISAAYGLQHGPESPVVAEAEKIPARRERSVYLTCCWLETLCTAETRVLGWVYQDLYGRPFRPDNF